MAQDIELFVADIRSNTDKLSASTIHDALVKFVKDEALMGESILKAIVTGFSDVSGGDTMARKAGHRGPEETGLEIEAAVGIPEIHKANESDPLSAKYPLFVEKGTGIFGDRGSPIFPKQKEFMKLPQKGDYSLFHKAVKGQPGKHFMAATFSAMIAMLKVNGEVFRAELDTKLRADKIL